MVAMSVDVCTTLSRHSFPLHGIVHVHFARALVHSSYVMQLAILCRLDSVRFISFCVGTRESTGAGSGNSQGTFWWRESPCPHCSSMFGPFSSPDRYSYCNLCVCVCV